MYDAEFDAFTGQWTGFAPEAALVTAVQVPTHKRLEGFDVTSFSARSSPECSPLSCNALATAIPVNRHCLFASFGEARNVLEHGLFRNAEPGSYRIFAVYSVVERVS